MNVNRLEAVARARGNQWPVTCESEYERIMILHGPGIWHVPWTSPYGKITLRGRKPTQDVGRQELDNISNLETDMYGLIGKIKAQPGQRDALITILIEGIAGMPGCLSYIVAKDLSDHESIWVTEVWDDKESHAESLSLASVKKAIELGKPLIVGFRERFETNPVGGYGLSKS